MSVNVKRYVGLVAVWALAVCMSPRDMLADVQLCGYVNEVECCTNVTPAGGCYCGPDSGQCNCRKTSGGIQDGIKVVCDPGPFDYVSAAPPAPEITPGSVVECAQNYKCKQASGSQVNCSTINQGTCPQPVPPGSPCEWRNHGEPWGVTTWVQGDPCDIPA
jgi:hypothetical protein